MRFVMGVVFGIIIATIFPDIVPATKRVFIDSGIRDTVIESLYNLKKD
jgi:hypothetical protein